MKTAIEYDKIVAKYEANEKERETTKGEKYVSDYQVIEGETKTKNEI